MIVGVLTTCQSVVRQQTTRQHTNSTRRIRRKKTCTTKLRNSAPITTKPNPVQECIRKREEIITTNVMVTVDSITSQDT